jgi:hypothetical protein
LGKFFRRVILGRVAVRSLDQLRRGARAHSLLYAARLAKRSDRPYDVAWQRLNYTRSSPSGARGTVCFSKQGAVAIFFDGESPQAPQRLKEPYRLDAHFESMPEPLMQHVRREALESFVLEVGSAAVPVVTAAFWSDAAGQIVSARPWVRVLEGGAHLVASELGRLERSIAAWSDEYGLSPEQAKIARRLFAEAAKSPAATRISLSAEDRAGLGIVTNQTTRELLEGARITIA